MASAEVTAGNPGTAESGGGQTVDRTAQGLNQLKLNVQTNGAHDEDSDDEPIDLGQDHRKSPLDGPTTSREDGESNETVAQNATASGGGAVPERTASFHVDPDLSPSEGDVTIDNTAELHPESEGKAATDEAAAGNSPLEGAEGEKPLTVELIKKKEALDPECATYTVAQEEEQPPSYEEAMGMLIGQGTASNVAANQMPRSSANQPRAAKTQTPIAVAAPGGGNLYYLDFIPHLDFRKSTEPFNQLVDRANHWLHTNPQYSVVNCETVIQYWARSHGYNPYRVVATRSKISADPTICMHVLRLWFKVDSQQMTPQFLYYQDFWTPYEKNISDLIDMINSPTFSIPGVILRIETVLHNRGSTAGQSFFQRMRQTCWFESSADNKIYTFFLRVFTLWAPSQSHRRGRVGFMDFLPERKADVHAMHPRYCFPHARFETFPALMRNFHWWLNNKLSSTSRLVTVHSVPVKIKTGGSDYWQRVSFTEKCGVFGAPSEYLVILRAFYEDFGQGAPPAIQYRNMTCRSFAPMQLTDGPVLRFETFIKMAERVALWVKLTGAKVRSVETAKIPMYPTAVQDRFSEVDPRTYTSWQILPKHYADHSHWIYAIRLYLDEPVEEPPVHSMPTAPNVVPYHLTAPPSTIAIQPGTKY